MPGMHWYFKQSSDEEREHAMKLLKYLNKRGGRIVLSDIENPGKKEWGTAQEAMEAALGLEKRVNEVRYIKVYFWAFKIWVFLYIWCLVLILFRTFLTIDFDLLRPKVQKAKCNIRPK